MRERIAVVSIFVFLGLLFSAPSVFSTTYYIDGTGFSTATADNSFDGTAAVWSSGSTGPWATMDYGVAQLIAGDICWVRYTTYLEEVDGFAADGTSGNEICLYGDTNGTAWGTSNARPIIDIETRDNGIELTKNYWVISGFEFAGGDFINDRRLYFNDADYSVADDCWFNSGTSVGIQFYNCTDSEVRFCTFTNSPIDAGIRGMYFKEANTGCRIVDSSFYGWWLGVYVSETEKDISVRRCKWYECNGRNVENYEALDPETTITDCFSYNAGSSNVFVRYCTPKTLIANNTVIGGSVAFHSIDTGTRIYNNIITDYGKAFHPETNWSDCTNIDWNILTRNTTDFYNMTEYGAYNSRVCPWGEETDGWRIDVGSSAYNTGTDGFNWLGVLDIEKQTRPFNEYDIGAFENQLTSPTPTVTPTPTPTSTPTPCNAWVWLTDVTDITLGWIEYTSATALGIYLVDSGPGEPPPPWWYGWIYDAQNAYDDVSEFYDHPRLWLQNDAGYEITIPEGYYFDVYHNSPDATSPLRIWLAQTTVPNAWEWLSSIGTDGTVYTDTSNCAVWKAPVTPSPTPSASPTPSPTVTSTPTPTPGWFADWSYREKVTIDAEQVPSDQSSFPVLISLDPTESQVFWHAQTTGNDILFAPGENENKWAHEIEDYNSHTQTGQLIAWVNVPQLASQTDTVFYMYYGNSGASDQQDVPNTWNSNYKGVWHIGEGTGTTVGDSTVEGNNGRSAQDTGWTSSTGGEIDGAYDLDGSSDFFTVTDDSSLKPTNITLETWINPEDIPYAVSYPGLFDTHYTYAYSFLGKDNDELSAYFHISGNLRILTTSGLNLGADTWYYAAAKYDGSNIKILVDGVEKASMSIVGSLDTGGFDLLLGHGRGGIVRWKGHLDEMRLSDVARSNDWLLTTYYSQVNPAGFSECTSQQAALSPTPTPIPSPSPSGGGERKWTTPFTMPTKPPPTTPVTAPEPTAVPIEELLLAEPGDYDGDGTVEPAVFRPSIGLWSIRGYTKLYFGRPTGQPVPGVYGGGGVLYDLPASGDYDGDGTADIAIFRPTSGLWSVRDITREYFGITGDGLIPGDYDGDGICDIAIFRAATGLWAVKGLTKLYFGGVSDAAVPGDYDGDGAADIAIFRSSTGLWKIMGITLFYFGEEGDIAVAGDYDGSGSLAAGIFRPASGLWAIRGITRLYFGLPHAGVRPLSPPAYPSGSDPYAGDLPVPGDYDGDLVDDIAIFRPTSGLWAIRDSTRLYLGK